MKLWAALRDAWLGWVDIVRLRPGWQDRFGVSFGALAKALVIFFLFAFLAIAMGAVQDGLPGLTGLAVNLLVQGFAVVALVIGIAVTKMAVKSDVRMLVPLVPGIYGLSFSLLVGSVLSAFSPEAVLLIVLVLLFLLYSLGRAAGGWTIGVSVAFAVLTVLLLVAVPQTLYMLHTPAGSPT